MRASPTPTGGAYAWGGSLTRITEASFVGREDAGNLHGARIHVDALRFQSETPSVDNYMFYQLGAWRVAMRPAPPAVVAGVLQRIATHGPAAAGYIRMGDTLIPVTLPPTVRAALVAKP